MIGAVAREAEDYAQIALLDQTIRILLPRWPRGHVRLPIVPILDRASVSVTINTEPWPDTLLDGGSRPLLIMCGNPPPGVVVIEYRAGFGALPEAIPADIRQAMLDQVAATLPAKFEHQAELFGKRLEPLAQSMAKLTDETRRTMWTAQRDLAQWRQARMKEVADWNVRKATWAKEHAALMSQLRGTAVQLRRDQAKSLFQQMLIGSLVGAASGLAALVIGWSLLRAAGRI